MNIINIQQSSKLLLLISILIGNTSCSNKADATTNETKNDNHKIEKKK